MWTAKEDVSVDMSLWEGKTTQNRKKNMMVLFITTVVRETNHIIWAPFKYNKQFYLSPMHVYLNSQRPQLPTQ
jgi:hypothetical protein